MFCDKNSFTIIQKFKNIILNNVNHKPYELFFASNNIPIFLFGSLITFFTISKTVNVIEKIYLQLKYYIVNRNYIFYKINVEDDLYNCKKIALLMDFAIKNDNISKTFLARIFKSDRYHLWPSLDKQIFIPSESIYYKINYSFFGGNLYIKPEYLYNELFAFTLSYHRNNVIFKKKNILDVITNYLSSKHC